MKHSLAASLLTLASVASAAVVDVVSGEPISSGYYAYHTQFVTTTCYHTVTKEGDCKYGGDYPQNTVYETVYGDYPMDYFGGDPKPGYPTPNPQAYPGSDYSGYQTIYETVYETAAPYPYQTPYPYPYDSACYPQTVYSTVYSDAVGVYHTVTEGDLSVYHTVTVTEGDLSVYHTVTEGDISVYHTVTEGGVTITETEPMTITATPLYHSFTQTESDFITVTTVIDNGGGGSQCTDGPWIRNPEFDSWGLDWFEYEIHNGRVDQWFAGGTQGMVAQFVTGVSGGGGNGNGNEPQLLEQAIVVPGFPSFGLTFSARRTDNADKGTMHVTFYLGSTSSTASITIPPIGNNDPAPDWVDYTLSIPGIGTSTDECYPVIFRIEVTGEDVAGQSKTIQIDNVVLH